MHTKNARFFFTLTQSWEEIEELLAATHDWKQFAGEAEVARKEFILKNHNNKKND